MKIITSSIIAIMFIATYTTTVDKSRTTGNGNIVKKTINIEDYQEFEFSGSAEIVYKQKANTEPYLQIEVDENIYPLIEIKSEKGKLRIGGNNSNFAPTKYVIYTNSTKLTSVNLAGSAKYSIKGSSSEKSLKIKVAGSSIITGRNLIYEDMLIHSAGSSKIDLKGEVNKVICNSSGSGNINIIDMKAQKVKCSIAGSTIIKTHAEKTLNVRVAGSGKIEYKGNPDVNKKIAGSGKVNKVN